MRADPNPSDRIPTYSAKGAMVIAYSNREKIGAAAQAMESQRGMGRIATPQPIVLDSQLLNVAWERFE